jgi:hypothetical protein
MIDDDTEYDTNKAMEEWGHISVAINNIFSGQSKEVSYEELYNKVFDLTINRFAVRTYQLLEENIKKNITKLVQSLSDQQEGD